MEPLLAPPVFQSSLCWEDGRSRAACLHEPSLFRLWCDRQERLIRALACLPRLRDTAASRPQRCAEHLAARESKWGRADPSGANAARWGMRSLSIHRASARVECQMASSGLWAHWSLWKPALRYRRHYESLLHQSRRLVRMGGGAARTAALLRNVPRQVE